MRFHPGVIASPSTALPVSGKYSYNWAQQIFSTPDGPIADPLASGLFTFARTTPLMAPDVTGKFYQYPANTPAINTVGWWKRGDTRTNYIRNNSMIGAVVGTPGTLPGGNSTAAWLQNTAPAGITTSVVAVGANDPQLNLPYIDLRFSGTATANGTYGLQFGGNSQIPASESNVFLFSAWLQLMSGTLLYDTAVKLQLQYASPTGGYLGQSAVTIDRLMNRDSAPRRLKIAAVAPTNTGSAKLNMYVYFRSGQVYDLVIRIIAPQCEKIPSIASDASSPILTTNAAVTHAADSIQASGSFLRTLASGGTLEMTTTGLSGSGIDFRVERPLIGFNGTIQALKRGVDGSITSDLASKPKTYRSWRALFGWEQQHALQWSASGVRVASTASRDLSPFTGGSIPLVTTMSFDYDGCMKALVYQDSSSIDLSSYSFINADHVIYGATSGGVVAAAETIKNGSTAAIVGGWRETQPGGMTTGGLGAVDASDVTAFGGMSRDWVKWVAEYRGSSAPDSLNILCAFSLRYFEYLIQKYKIPMYWSKGVVTVVKNPATRRITSFTTRATQLSASKIAQAKFFTDCTYEGDLMALAGVAWIKGREAKDVNNPWNGNQGTLPATSRAAGMGTHEFTLIDGSSVHGSPILNVDPWIIPGDPNSGLLPGVQPDTNLPVGAADESIQAYCFRMTMVTDPTIKVPLSNTPPPGYNKLTYELLGRFFQAVVNEGYSAVPLSTTLGPKQFNLGQFILINGFDMNSNGGFSIDTLGQNWAYPTADYDAREIFWKWQENFQRGFWYYVQYENDPRIPAVIRSDALQFGFMNDHYLDPHENDQLYWMTQLYVREARRMIGTMVLNASDVTAADDTTPRSTNVIATGSYSIDSHHVRRMPQLVNGIWRTLNEGEMFGTTSPNKRFPIAMEYIMPTRADCTNLLVTFAASAKHTGFGALRMELAHMATSQSAGAMAAQLVQEGAQSDVQDINYQTLRSTLLTDGQVVTQLN